MVKRKLYLLLILVVLFLIIAYLYNLREYKRFNSIIRLQKLELSDEKIIKKPQRSLRECKIPHLDPYDKSITKYIFKPKPFKCSNVEPLITSDLSHLYINQDLLQVYKVTDPNKFYCCYKPFTRKDPKGMNPDILVDIQDCIPFYSKFKIKDEFVIINCIQNKKILHQDVHSFVPIKKSKNNKAKNKRKPNVLIFGIDSLSRMNYERQMPKTKKYIDENLNPILMANYNKVGDNTFLNLIPILTGQTVEEISKTCWKSKQSHFDGCPFIWKKYSNEGYLTAFAEDCAWMGLFNYQKRGFKSQPTDYYWRTYNQYAEKHFGHFCPKGSCLCIGPRATHKILIDYVEKFTLSLKNEPYFGLFWSTGISHDKLNDPALGDEDYAEFFKRLKKSGVLNDTIMIFLSDHGIRFGDIRFTYQGHLEERLPYLYFIFPQWFTELYPTAIDNMKENSNRLTSNFDLHETLNDLLNYEELTAENLKERSRVSEEDRGISLFLSIPKDRSCEMAGISDHWCTCYDSVEVNTNHTTVQKIGNYIVSYINDLLKSNEQCETLILDEINSARLVKSVDYFENNKILRDYTLILRTIPSKAMFESTVRCVDCDNENVFEITGIISRINTYGNQSTCIADAFLKLYCFCK